MERSWRAAAPDWWTRPGSHNRLGALQHRRERLRWVGERRWIHWNLALDQTSRHREIALRVDPHRVRETAVADLEHQHAIGAQWPMDTHAIGRRPPDALNIEV